MNSSSSDVNVFEWRTAVTSFVTFQPVVTRYVWRLVCRINISKVANETNSYRTTPSLDSTESFLSAARAPSSGAAMLYNVPCYHNYSPLSCYQVRFNGFYAHQPRSPRVIKKYIFIVIEMLKHVISPCYQLRWNEAYVDIFIINLKIYFCILTSLSVLSCYLVECGNE